MKYGEIFNKDFCKNKIQFIPNKTAEIANFHFSHDNSMAGFLSVK